MYCRRLRSFNVVTWKTICEILGAMLSFSRIVFSYLMEYLAYFACEQANANYAWDMGFWKTNRMWLRRARWAPLAAYRSIRPLWSQKPSSETTRPRINLLQSFHLKVTAKLILYLFFFLLSSRAAQINWADACKWSWKSWNSLYMPFCSDASFESP